MLLSRPLSISFLQLIAALSCFPANGALISPQATTKQPTAESVIKSAATSTGAVCTTATCKAIAKKFLDRINGTVDPCEDFYEYSCGKWIANQKDYDVNEFTKLTEKTRTVGKDLLKGKIKPKGKTFDAEVKVKSLYKQCTNQAQIEELRGIPVIRILDEHLGGWPLIRAQWNAANFSLVDALVNSYHFGSQSLLSVKIDPDVENPSRNLITLDAPKIFVQADLLRDKESAPDYLQAYVEAIQSVTKFLLRDTNQTTDIKHLAANITDIVQLENYLSLNMLTKAELNNDTILLNKFSLRQFKDRYRFNSSLLRNITQCLQSFFAPANLSHAITDDTVIIVPSLRYWPKLDEKLVELEKQGVEGRRRLASYIGWKVIYSVLDYLSKDYQAITGDPDASVEDHCLDIVKAVMPLAVGALYVRDIVPHDTKAQATMMVNDIHWGFRALLEEATWMDNVTYEGALQKLAAISEIVAYPDFMANNLSAIDLQYQMVAVQGTFIRSVLLTNKNNLIQQMTELTKIRVLYDPVRDTPDISVVNANYEPIRNQLTVLAAILRIPFFEASAPQYLNYGGIGYVIGHEITHGFDDTGARYDSVGVRRLWWTNKTVDAVVSRANGLIEQYNRYTMPSGKVNGELTAGENIADNGGLRASLKGYTRFLQRLTTPEAVLPGMEKFTPLQLFFLAAGQVWCENPSPETERYKLLMDAHAPGKWRVNGPLSNIPEFAQSFKCPLGSKMNPKIKNRVW